MRGEAAFQSTGLLLRSPGMALVAALGRQPGREHMTLPDSPSLRAGPDRVLEKSRFAVRVLYDGILFVSGLVA